MEWPRPSRRHRTLSGCARTVVALALLAALTSCGERGPTGPEYQSDPPAPRGLSVSEPSAEDQNLAYVSASPGTFPGGQSVSVTNPANAASASAPIQNGGFDPVAVPADPGDELQVVVEFADGSSALFLIRLPTHRPPRVVRTRPPKGDTDVVLNITAAVVFSEPVDASTVTQQTVQLRLDGAPVEGVLSLKEDGLVAEIAPAELLLPGREYTLVITREVLDLTGDPLEEEVHSTFTTVGSQSSSPAQIAFVSDDEIYVVNSDGTDRIQLTASPGREYDPTWSPDGTRIAFTSMRDGDAEIYVMNANGSDQINLSKSPGHDLDPSWSPDGSKIAFDASRGATDDSDIYVVNSDGTDLVNLTDAAGAASDWDPLWSPIGSRIAFISMRDGNLEVYAMSTDGSDPVNLSNSPGCDGNAVWSPSELKTAFTSTRDGNSEVYVADANAMSQAKFTSSPGGEYDLDWSRDGTRITFRYQGDEGVSNAEIYVMNADGSGRMNLSNSPGHEYYPKWSPDGSQIAFEYY
ncbi:MAG: Ig-like domain-containing protein, partial [Gemmatimonadales bacterium]